MELEFDEYENNEQLENINEQIKDCKNYILNYDKNNREDFHTFLQSVSSYNWLKQNKKYVKNTDDLNNIIKSSNELISKIEEIVDNGLDFNSVTTQIQKFLQTNTSLQNKEMFFEFDISLCNSLESIRDKIKHHRDFLYSIEEHSIDNVMQR